jgi:osmoprotectant transport system permease protein
VSVAALADALALPLAQAGEGFVRDADNPSTECVASNDTICFGWIGENFDRYTGPALEHLAMVGLAVFFGFAIAFAMALFSHGRRWVIPIFTGTTGVIYTIPSIALFIVLLPITGRGTLTAVIALTLYNLQIIYRNIVVGLNGVPTAAKDAGRGMGMTDRQLLWRVELPLALPEIVAGIRIATVSTVAIATLAVFAGAGGLGAEIYSDITFKTGIFVAGGLCIAIAITFDLLLVLAERGMTPWRRARSS